MSKCDNCEHCFKPKMTCLPITEFRDQIRACSSQSVWVVHNNRWYRLHSLGRTNYSWRGWCYGTPKPMTLSDLWVAFDNGYNWEYLNNYSLSIHIEETNSWVYVFRIEQKFYTLEDIEGEILIHVHTEEEVLAAYEERESR